MNILLEIHQTADWITFIGFIIVGIIIFLLLREFFAWYTKMNDVVKHLKRNNELLEKLTGEKPEEKPEEK